MVKRILLILLVLATLSLVACDDDPLAGIFDVWDSETLPPSDSKFDLYDTQPEETGGSTTTTPTIELPPLPG